MKKADSSHHFMNWYCVYTKPKHEDIVCTRISALNEIECLNPKLKKGKLVRKKYIEFIEPLFPCYLFLKFNASKYYHLINNTRGVKRVLCNGEGEPYIVDPRIIEVLQHRMQNNFISTSLVAFEKGDNVEVKGGVFERLKGIYIKNIRGSERALILLNALEYQARIELNKNLLVKV